MYDNGATVGAVAGTNLKQNDGTVLSDADVRNDDLQIDYQGTTVRIKKGSTTVINEQAAPTGLKNDQVVLSSGGTLSYSGGTNQTLDLDNITDSGDTKTGAAKAEAGLDSSGNLTAGIKSGSTTFTAAEAINVRAGFDSLSTTPILKVANANSGLKNATININSNGQITGINSSANNKRIHNDIIEIDLATSGANRGRITLAGIGSTNTTVDVTKSNLGLSYDDGATVGAVAGTNLKQNNGTLLGDNDVITSQGTANNVSFVGSQTVANAQQGVIAANLGFTTSGVVKKIVPKEQGGLNEDISNKTGVLDFSSGTANFRATLPTSRGGFGLNVASLFGSTVGRLPRWNGTAFVSAAENDFKNDQIIDGNGNIRSDVDIGLPNGGTFSIDALENVKNTFTDIDSAANIKLDVDNIPLDGTTIDKSGGNLILKDEAVSANKLAASIAYTGTITAGSGTNLAGLTGRNAANTGAGSTDTDVRIFAGSTFNNRLSAPFNVTQAGSVRADEVFIGSTSGTAMSVATGTNRFQIRTPGSGTTGTVLEVGGDSNTTYVPLKVSNDGTGDIRGFNIFTSGGTKLFDASTGFTSEAFTEIAEATGASVSSISKTSSGNADSDAQKITIGSSQTITVKAAKNAVFSGIGINHSGNSSLALSTAYSKVPNSVVVKVFHSTSNSRSGATQVGGTLSFSEYSSGTQSATEYKLDEQVETEPGFAFAEVELIRGNHSNSSMSQSFSASAGVGAGTASFASNGYFTLEFTHTVSAGDHYYWVVINGTGSSGTGTVGDVTDDSAVRVLTLTAASGSTFNVSGGDGSETSDDVHNNTITLAAGSGLTTGGDFTVNQSVNETITFNIGQGTGITVNANDIAVNTGAVTNGASTIPTGDHVYDFVTGQINNLIDGAPGTLNTLNELAAALDDDDDFHAAVTTSLAGKLSLTGGAMTGAITTNSTFDGRDVSVDGAKLDNIASNANNYSLPAASSSTRGGVKIGYTENGKNYPVELSNEKMYVNVPWTDTSSNNNFLDGITKSGNTLTFSVNGTTNQTFTFGSNAFNSTSYLPLAGGTVTGLVKSSNGILVLEQNTGKRPKIEFHENTDGTAEAILEYNGTGSGAGNYVALYSGVSGWTTIGNGLNFIPSNGRVGIGLTNPSEKLSVAGNISVTGTVDGRDIATDGGKLDNIDSNADVTPSWVPSTNPNYLTSFDITTQTDSKYLRSNANDTYTGILTFGSGGTRIYGSDNFPLVQVNSNRAYFGSTSRAVSTIATNSTTGLKANVSGTDYTVFHAGNSAQFTSALNTKLSNIATGADVTPSWVPSTNPNYVTSSGNTVIGTDLDINTSGATVIDQLNMTDGVIQSHSTRTLTLANLGYTGATNANNTTINTNANNRVITGGSVANTLNGEANLTFDGTTLGVFGTGGINVTTSATGSGSRRAFHGLHSSNNTIEIHQFGQSHSTAPAVNQIGVSNAEQHLHLVTDTSANIDAGTSTKGIMIRSGGNVGIGTASPNADFQVIGPAVSSVPAAGSGGVGGAIFSADLNSYGMFVGSITNGNGYIQQQRTNTATYYNLLLQPNGGKVRIGSSSQPTEALHVTGNILATANVSAYSDERLKTNIETLDSKKALQMRGVSFTKDGVKSSGVIAQEVEKIAPELVLTADDEMGTKSVAYGNLVGYLIETVKELKSEIDELKERLDNDISK